jgi:hypothetical protein
MGSGRGHADGTTSTRYAENDGMLNSMSERLHHEKQGVTKYTTATMVKNRVRQLVESCFMRNGLSAQATNTKKAACASMLAHPPHCSCLCPLVAVFENPAKK